jgi:hypothetical protein
MEKKVPDGWRAPSHRPGGMIGDDMRTAGNKNHYTPTKFGSIRRVSTIKKWLDAGVQLITSVVSHNVVLPLNWAQKSKLFLACLIFSLNHLFAGVWIMLDILFLAFWNVENLFDV